MVFPENIIFDWDNTLVDSNDHLKWIMDQTIQILKNQGYLAMTPVSCYWQLPLSKLFIKYPTHVAKKAAKIYINLYQELPYSRVILFKGVQDILNFLISHKVNLYIISNKEGSFVRREASSLNVHQYFKSICGAGDTKHQKPSKEVIEKTLKNTFCPEKTLFVGDSLLDLQCANNARIKCILISEQAEIDKSDKSLITLPNLEFFLAYLKILKVRTHNNDLH